MAGHQAWAGGWRRRRRPRRGRRAARAHPPGQLAVADEVAPGHGLRSAASTRRLKSPCSRRQSSGTVKLAGGARRSRRPARPAPASSIGLPAGDAVVCAAPAPRPARPGTVVGQAAVPTATRRPAKRPHGAGPRALPGAPVDRRDFRRRAAAHGAGFFLHAVPFWQRMFHYTRKGGGLQLQGRGGLSTIRHSAAAGLAPERPAL